jgi:hypothetical protein
MCSVSPLIAHFARSIEKNGENIVFKKPSLYFAVFCFAMAFMVAYRSGDRGLLSVVIFLVMGVVSFLRARGGDEDED